MKILLIVPTNAYKRQYPAFLSVSDFPTGFAYLASALQTAGFEVFGLNANNDPSYDNSYQMMRDKITNALKSIQPDMVCTGGLCIDYLFLRDTIRLVRDLAPDVPIVLGGGIVSHDAEYIFKILRPDFCIEGEGEEVLVQLARCLESGQKQCDHISNLGYWENGNPRFTKQDFNYLDLNQRAFPDYEPFGIREMLDKYSMASVYHYRYPRVNPRPMPIVTGRGCPFNCTFCVHRKGIKYRTRDISNILKEIGVLYEKYEFNILIILDELFAVNKTRLRNFSEAILEARSSLSWDFDWLFQSHLSASFDQDTLAIARKAGCYFFSCGLESASPRVLASMRKKTKPSQIIEAIKVADTSHIGFGGNFIFGDVAETKETLGETMNFFHQHCRDIHIYFDTIKPFPGSWLFDYCLEHGIIQDKLQFYENERIREGVYNMTKIPDILWWPWVRGLHSLESKYLWAKSVEALSCQVVTKMANNPMVLSYGKQIYEIGAVCPFCEKKFHFNEFVGKGKVKSSLSHFSKIKAKIKNKKWFVNLFFFVINLLPIWRPYKLLSYIYGQGGYGDTAVVTGCPHCNKRLRITLNVGK